MKWFALLLWGLCCLPGSAQEEVLIPAPGGIIERFRANQGPLVLMQAQSELPVAAIAVSVPLGSSRNPAARGGAAQMLGYLLRRSTADYPLGGLGVLEEELGARSGYRVCPERTVFWQVVPRNQVGWALQAALGRMRPPPLNDKLALRAYRAVSSEWRTTAPLQRMHQLLAMQAYASGAPMNLVGSSSADLDQLGLQYLNSQDTVVAVVGGFSPQAVRTDMAALRSNLGQTTVSPPVRAPVLLESEPSPKVEWLWRLPTRPEDLALLCVAQEYLRDQGLEAELDWELQTFSLRHPILSTAKDAEADMRKRLAAALATPFGEGWRRLQGRATRHWLEGIDDLGRRAVALAIDQSVSQLDRFRATPDLITHSTPLTTLSYARAFLSEATASRGLPAVAQAAPAPEPAEQADVDGAVRKKTRAAAPDPDYRPAALGAPPFTRLELDKGVTLLVQTIRDLDTVTVRGFLASGTLLDPPAMTGRTQLLAATLGQRGQPSDSVQLHFDPQLQFISVDGWSTREGLADWLGSLFAAMAPGPLANEWIERARVELVNELQGELRREEAQGYQSWLQLLYPEDHPLGRSTQQNLAGLQARTPADVNALANQTCRPDRLTLVVTGNVTSDEVVSKLAPHISAWNITGSSSPPPVLLAPSRPRPDVPPLLRLPGRGRQALILVGKPGPSRKDPDYYAFTMLNQILGGDASTSRLAQRLRDKERLAGAVQSRFLAGSGPMPWLISLRVDRDKVDPALGMIREELARLAKEGPTPAEMTRAVHSLEGQLQVAQSSSWGRASLLRNLELFRLSDSYAAGFAGLYRGLTAKDLIEVAKRRLSTDDLCTVIVSP